MFRDFDKYVGVFLTALLGSFVLTPLIRKQALRLGVVDQPSERRLHKGVTARGGGLAVIIAVHLACLFGIFVPWTDVVGDLDIDWWYRFAGASLILLVLGLFDDIRGIRPSIKLAGQILAAWLIAISGTRFGTIMGFRLPVFLDHLMVVVWIVGVINAFNLIDGLDGLASGLAIISSIGLCGVFGLGNLPGTLVVLVALAGACFGFLRFNFHPASIFLGDTGSMFIGFTLGVVALQTFAKSSFVLSIMIPLMVLGIPIFDEFLAVWRRSVQQWIYHQQASGFAKHIGLMQPDVEHLHHRLLRAGLSTRRAAMVLFAVNGVMVGFGLLLTSFKSHTSGIFLIGLLAGVYVVLRHLAAIELRDTANAILLGLRRPSYPKLKALTYPLMDVFWMSAALAVAMWTFGGHRVAFWHTWFLALPVWVIPTFSLLAISRAYVTIWARARAIDVLILLWTLQAGLLLSLGIALLITPFSLHAWIVRALVVGGLSHPAMLLTRCMYRLIEEVAIHFETKNSLKLKNERIVLYGSGELCQTFLRKRDLENLRNAENGVVVGLIEDEPWLHGQWIYGQRVLGDLKDLIPLIKRLRISRIVIACEVSSTTRTTITDLARTHRLTLCEWSSEERQLIIHSPSHSIDPAGKSFTQSTGPRVVATPATIS